MFCLFLKDSFLLKSGTLFCVLVSTPVNYINVNLATDKERKFMCVLQEKDFSTFMAACCRG